MKLEIDLSDLYDEEGYSFKDGFRDAIVAAITKRLSDGEMESLRETALRQIESETQKAILPVIREAMDNPIRKTNTWGETTGETMTLREAMIQAAQKALNQKVREYDGSPDRSGKETLLGYTVRKASEKAAKDEIKSRLDEIKKDFLEQWRKHWDAGVEEVLKKG